ncbi:MAG: ABC transporter ATP-binding protein [Clostridia bacterium]|nr:ABC transporter ATP-binding protein [Clostridia bacterium]
MAVLETKNLCYTYDKKRKPVLNNVSISFDEGKTYAIMGKSGTGKTTLLSLLSGLEVPTSGEILYHGKNINKIDKYKFRSQNIGVIFQSFNLLPQLTALENVILSMDVSGLKIKDKKGEALKMLSKVDINEEKANRKILKLSGGEQQRVAIARALCYNPDIILADEPTGNLDEENQNEVVNILKSLARDDGKCVIIVTHSQSVGNACDEIFDLSSLNKKTE